MDKTTLDDRFEKSKSGVTPDRGVNMCMYVSGMIDRTNNILRGMNFASVSIEDIDYSQPLNGTHLINGKLKVEGMPCEFSYDTSSRDLYFKGFGDSEFEADILAKELGANLNFETYPLRIEK
ncbi:hypothetical protein C0585_01695 [Candidatus Woesearchaeota archaeon]|nr:MAG: hypothetical protein C0585_01695 [Candidatus Woesearchaeota archaeon]